MEVNLSDNAKRYLCRAGFVLFCALPTLLCLNAVLFPKTNSDWSAQFQQQFGVINQIGQVQVISPRRTDFRDLVIGADRFSSRITIDTASLQSLDDGRVLFIETAEGSVDAFWESLGRIVETVAWSGKSDRPVRLHFGTMKFLESGEPAARTCVWRDLHIDVNQKGQLISASFVPESTTKQFVNGQSVATLERKINGQKAAWYIDAIGFRIPAWVLKPMVPAAAALNAGCELADGRASLTQHNDRWSGEFKEGRLLDVDLIEVVAARFGTQVTGRAMVNINAARIANNRIEFLDGDLHCPAGTISSQLLHASNQAMGMQLVEPYGQTPTEAFTDLRLGFKLELDKIAIYTMESGSIMNDADGHRMLIAEHGQNRPVSSLVKLVSWPMDRFNANTASLAKYLMISPVEIDPDANPKRTAQHDEVGQGTFFNR